MRRKPFYTLGLAHGCCIICIVMNAHVVYETKELSFAMTREREREREREDETEMEGVFATSTLKKSHIM
jgi:hypothetical protein